MLLNSLKCPEQSHNRIFWSEMLLVLRLGNPSLGEAWGRSSLNPLRCFHSVDGVGLGVAEYCWAEWKPVKVACKVLFLHLWENLDFSSQTHVFSYTQECCVIFLKGAFFSALVFLPCGRK